MDTGTHIAMGFGLAGLAYLDPAVSAHPELASAVLLGTLIGSQAPDFDTVLKLRGNATYIRNHRGRSHSIPAIFIWTALVSGGVYAFFPGVSYLHLLLWTLLAVVVHVSIDLFNSYGTQAARPFSKRWISLNVINIFDPFIMGIHIIGFLFWAAGFSPGHVFSAVYAVMITYIIQRVIAYNKLVNMVKADLGEEGHYILLPTIRWTRWGIVAETSDASYVGELRNKHIIWHDTFYKKEHNKIIERAKQDANVRAFLSFTRYPHVYTKKREFGHEVRWIDLRYRTKTHYAFVAIVHLDEQLNVIDSYTGWEYREHKMESKVLVPELVLEKS
ncbi:metal-dependent hydrolase [Aneurinibacillus aneurinilyticus]|uniref:Metal-dependent hydrolase n=2 Tax=Aneurinibacillus aneurinilyticus TaxID=1391 RepID=A0A848CQT9_ANEAE|nr:metal-dependent hydrolase [Aneurinibacillus aneurinilyticus]MCI1696211.1 metal-dependent hydrolase [Aneurinibacillus aneurinilyticus]MED0670350.1 metal-dependent hydrolase [Aneurinibacillus aneurinilyticus]MED0707034.1 metal-dependent hydrolase [Aneurinibacillus aneurinilyticus]MED0723522.1 metal-dependent hydrolase [Aneurinibacillus aneurinilyticus]MED0732897.1 metal-dependent hydrolase [Aneurinibacillus aneurinilyticus]